MIDGVQEWRPARLDHIAGYVLCAMGFGYILLTLYVILGIGMHQTPKNDAESAAATVMSIAWVVWGFALARARLVLTDETLTVVSGLRTRWFLLEQVADVRLGPLGIYFVMKDGQKVRSMVTALDRRQQQSQKPGAIRRRKRAYEIQSAVLTSATRVRATRSGLILPRG